VFRSAPTCHCHGTCSNATCVRRLVERNATVVARSLCRNDRARIPFIQPIERKDDGAKKKLSRSDNSLISDNTRCLLEQWELAVSFLKVIKVIIKEPLLKAAFRIFTTYV